MYLTFRCTARYALRLNFDRVAAVNRTDCRNVARGINGIAGELALPCALTPRPAETVSFQCFAHLSRRDFIKENLQAVFVIVRNYFSAVKLPALEANLPILRQRFQPLLDAVDFLIVVGKCIGRIRRSLP